MDLQYIKNRISLLLFIIIIILFVSCASYKDILISGSGNYQEAMHNAMVDYVKNELPLIKSYPNYVVDISETNQKYYYLTIHPNVNYYTIYDTSITKESTKYMAGFPNEAKKIGKILFVIFDSTKNNQKYVENLLQEVGRIDTLNKHNYTQDGGFTLTATHPFIIDEKMEAVNYFICKSDISIMKKVKSSKVLTKEDYPKLDCPPAPH